MKRFQWVGGLIVLVVILVGLFFYWNSTEKSNFQIAMGFYTVEDGAVRYWGEPIAGADMRSFQILSDAYAKDSHQVYFYGDPMSKQVDAQSFKLINDFYAQDKNHYYVAGESLREIDYHTFKIIDGPFAEDLKGQYYVGEKVENADFHSLDKLTFSLDHKYLEQFKVGGDLPESFSSQTQQYWRDNHQVYFESESAMGGYGLSIIENADHETMKILNGYYAVDKNDLYIYGYREKNGLNFDYETIEPLQYGSGYLRDKNSVFGASRDGMIEIEDVDVETFQYFENTAFSKDKNRIYFASRPFAEADYVTFHVELYKLEGTMITVLGKDKNGCYAEDRKVACPSDQYLFSWDDI